MEEKAFLYYGFNLDEALLVRDTISAALDEEVDTISASGEENSTIEDDLLDRMPDGNFTEAPVRFLMFLGFDDEDTPPPLSRRFRRFRNARYCAP